MGRATIPSGTEYDYQVNCKLAAPGDFSYDFIVYTSCPGKFEVPLTVKGKIVAQSPGRAKEAIDETTTKN